MEKATTRFIGRVVFVYSVALYSENCNKNMRRIVIWPCCQTALSSSVWQLVVEQVLLHNIASSVICV